MLKIHRIKRNGVKIKKFQKKEKKSYKEGLSIENQKIKRKKNKFYHKNPINIKNVANIKTIRPSFLARSFTLCANVSNEKENRGKKIKQETKHFETGGRT